MRISDLSSVVCSSVLGGWLGIAMPEAVGGAGLGLTEAALMMERVANSAGAMAAASSIHINIFGLHPVVVFGTEAQQRRFLPPLIAGRARGCFGVTAPDAGLDTGRLKTMAVRDGDRSEGLRVGKACVRTCRSRRAPYHIK